MCKSGTIDRNVCVSLFFCSLLPVFFACTSSAPASGGASSADAMAAAQAALDRMDGKGQSGGNTAAGSGAQSGGGGQSSLQNSPGAQQQGAAVNTSRNKPAWVDAVDSVYSRSQYAAAVGYASGREMAERNALGNLTAIFGQSIQADQTIIETYREAVKNGVTDGYTDTTDIKNKIQTSASMDTLVGAEIKEVWYDSKSTYYAVAAMEKAKTAQIYSDLILANLSMINKLITMTPAEKNSLDGFSRYQFAAVTADINTSYANLLKVIDAAPPAGLKPGDDYRLEAKDIIKLIPVNITVKNDQAGRIQSAFAKALADMGFRSGGGSTRYRIDAEITLAEAQLPNQQNKFVRYVLDANLVDTANGTVTLMPYNINGREGHSTLSEAENRAVRAAERKIGEEYRPALAACLSQLLPKK